MIGYGYRYRANRSLASNTSSDAGGVYRATA